jgi:hypothetical protein
MNDKHPGGRPSRLRSHALANRICALLAEGLSLRKVCDQLGFTQTFVFDWIHADPAFAKQYTCARERQTEVWMDQLVDLSDGATPENAHVARLQVETRKWIASKMLPKKYGDRPAEISVNTQVNLAAVSVEDMQRLQARRQELLKEQGE